MGAEKPLKVCQAHPAGLCDVSYVENDGAVQLITCGADGKLCFRSGDEPSKPQKVVDTAHRGGTPAPCTAITASNNKYVAVGDVDNFVKVFSMEGEYRDVATKFTLPVQALAASPSGSTLAAGGDDEGIKLISTIDPTGFKVIRTLRTQPYTRGLAFDPESKYVASVSADGTLCVWDIVEGKTELQAKKACPKVDVASAARSRPAWHPDGGSLLAAPGTDKNIVLYERLCWEVAGELKGEHSGDVGLVAFSKNGLYLVSAASDQSVVVWDVLEKKALGKRVLAGTACGAAWHPAKNVLALITEDGELALWDGVIPSDLPGPNDDPDVLNGVAAKKGAAGEDPSMMGEGATAGGMGAGLSDDYDHEDSFIADEEEPQRAGGKRRRGGGGQQLWGGGHLGLDLTPQQDPIHPGSTQLGEGGRRYLCYNPLGCVVLKAEADHNTVEVTFHDTAKMRRRIPLFKDFYNLAMASLGEKGALYASRSNPDSPSTVLYQPYESWALNSDWSLGLPAGEEAECVAAGQTFCAVATSRRVLRLFSQAGLQRGVISLAGPPVALAAHGHLLAAVWHAAAPTPSGDQQLAYAVYDMAEQREVAAGALPLSPGATLAWLGFSTEGLLAASDSEGELRLRTTDWGGAWVPLFSSTAERKGTESFWVFGLSASQLQCIVVSGASEPSVPPPPQRPLVSSVPLKAPVVGQETALAPLEADAIRQGVLLSHLAVKQEDGTMEPERAEKELGKQQLEADKIGLKLIAKLVQMNRHARALEAASQLHTMRALEGALKVANQLRATALAEKLSAFIEQRVALEAEAAAAAAAEQQQQDAYYGFLAEQEQWQAGMEAEAREATTPIPGPSFAPSEAQQHAGGGGESPSAGPKSSRASPLPARQAEGGDGGMGMFARKPSGGQNAGPNAGGAGGGSGGATKRKASSANPFARKKAMKG